MLLLFSQGVYAKVVCEQRKSAVNKLINNKDGKFIKNAIGKSYCKSRGDLGCAKFGFFGGKLGVVNTEGHLTKIYLCKDDGGFYAKVGRIVMRVLERGGQFELYSRSFFAQHYNGVYSPQPPRVASTTNRRAPASGGYDSSIAR